MKKSLTSLPVLFATLAMITPADAQQNIGSVGAANPTIEGTAGTSEARILVIGSNVVQDELIETSAKGSGQILFADQTTLSIAPNSEIVLDRYVYDPDQSVGDIGMSLTKGALRFIGGRITKKTPAQLNTPTATIGIRGGTALVDVAANGETTIIHIAGEFTRVIANGRVKDLQRSGAKVIVRNGGKPEGAGIASVDEIDTFYAQFEGGGGGLRSALLPTQTAQGLASGVSRFGAGERGGERREVVATSGASPVIRDTVYEDEGDYQNTIVPEGLNVVAQASPPPSPAVTPPPPESGPEPFENETLRNGLTGVALFAPADATIGANTWTITNPEAQNVLLTPETVDLLPQVFASESGVIDGGVTTIDRVSRNGFNANGERYVIPIDPNGGQFQFSNGESPRNTDPTIVGVSDIELSTEFTTAFYEGITPDTRSQVFFGRGTPGQLGTPQGIDGPEQRIYSLRPDPFLGSVTPILPPSVSTLFDAPPDLTFRTIEEPGEGLFREDGANGFAKAGLGALTIEGTGTEQRALFVVGTGRVTPTSDNAPSPDIGIFATLNDGFGTTDTQVSNGHETLEGNATLVAFGDGSTLISENAENIVLASASRFIFDADEDFEVTPIVSNSFNGPLREARGFVHAGDLASQVELIDSERLVLGQSFATAVADNPDVFILQNDDTALDGGYVGGLGRSLVDGEVTVPYIIHSNGTGVQVSFDTSQNEANAALNFIGGPSSIRRFNGEGIEAAGNGIDVNPVIESGSLGFGSASTRSLLGTDRDFLLRNKTSEEHNFIQGSTQINGRTGRPAPAQGAEQQAFRGALASTGAVGDGGAAVFDSSVDTDHEYLRWGYWSGDFRFASEEVASEWFDGREERFNLGTFVAGNRLDEVDLPTFGVGTFDGFAVVSVSEGGRDYVDGGSFALEYDFSNRIGVAEFRDLAGYDFDSNVSGDNFTISSSDDLLNVISDTQTNIVREDSFAGTFESNAIGTPLDPDFRPAVDGTVAGSFFTDAAGVDVRATAGRIDFQSRNDNGASLIASGVFGGDGEVNIPGL